MKAIKRGLSRTFTSRKNESTGTEGSNSGSSSSTPAPSPSGSPRLEQLRNSDSQPSSEPSSSPGRSNLATAHHAPELKPLSESFKLSPPPVRPSLVDPLNPTASNDSVSEKPEPNFSLKKRRPVTESHTTSTGSSISDCFGEEQVPPEPTSPRFVNASLKISFHELAPKAFLTHPASPSFFRASAATAKKSHLHQFAWHTNTTLVLWIKADYLKRRETSKKTIIAILSQILEIIQSSYQIANNTLFELSHAEFTRYIQSKLAQINTLILQTQIIVPAASDSNALSSADVERIARAMASSFAKQVVSNFKLDKSLTDAKNLSEVLEQLNLTLRSQTSEVDGRKLTFAQQYLLLLKNLSKSIAAYLYDSFQLHQDCICLEQGLKVGTYTRFSELLSIHLQISKEKATALTKSLLKAMERSEESTGAPNVTSLDQEIFIPDSNAMIAPICKNIKALPAVFKAQLKKDKLEFTPESPIIQHILREILEHFYPITYLESQYATLFK